MSVWLNQGLFHGLPLKSFPFSRWIFTSPISRNRSFRKADIVEETVSTQIGWRREKAGDLHHCVSGILQHVDASLQKEYGAPLMHTGSTTPSIMTLPDPCTMRSEEHTSELQ